MAITGTSGPPGGKRTSSRTGAPSGRRGGGRSRRARRCGRCTRRRVPLAYKNHLRPRRDYQGPGSFMTPLGLCSAALLAPTRKPKQKPEAAAAAAINPRTNQASLGLMSGSCCAMPHWHGAGSRCCAAARGHTAAGAGRTRPNAALNFGVLLPADGTSAADLKRAATSVCRRFMGRTERREAGLYASYRHTERSLQEGTVGMDVSLMKFKMRRREDRGRPEADYLRAVAGSRRER